MLTKYKGFNKVTEERFIKQNYLFIKERVHLH